MKAMILAAGKGERMRPLTDVTPKPLLKAANKPLIMWHLDNLSNAGFKEIIINNAWLGCKIVEEIGAEYAGMKIIHSCEPECLETAGGIAFALEYLNDNNKPFAVINGDTFIPQLPVHEFIHIAENFGEEQQGFLYLVDNPLHNLKGDFILNIANNELYTKDDFITNEASYLENLTFSGMALYRPNMFADIVKGEHAKLAPLLNKGIYERKIFGTKFIKTWMDIGTPQRLEHVNNIVENGLHLV